MAVDTTLVSALDSAGQPRRHQRRTTGAALRVARRAKERTYPELLQSTRLVVLGIEIGGRWSSEAAQFIRFLARSRARSAPSLLRAGATAAYAFAGLRFCHLPQPEPSQPASCPFPSPMQPTSMAPRSSSAISSRKTVPSSFPRLPAASRCGLSSESWTWPVARVSSTPWTCAASELPPWNLAC